MWPQQWHYTHPRFGFHRYRQVEANLKQKHQELYRTLVVNGTQMPVVLLSLLPQPVKLPDATTSTGAAVDGAALDTVTAAAGENPRVHAFKLLDQVGGVYG